LFLNKIKFFPDQCFTPGTYSSASGMGSVVVTDIFACQQLCQVTSSCIRFEFDTLGKYCYRHSVVAGSQGSNSNFKVGPKYCQGKKYALLFYSWD